MTPTELVKVSAMIHGSKPMPPERIYGWQHSQLSIARYYGGCTYQGARYVIDYGAEGNPLVRADVLAAEEKAKREAARATRRAEKAQAANAQRALL